MRKLFLLFMALLATITLWAYDFKSGNLYYNFIGNNAVEVTYHSADPYITPNYPGLVAAIIPETVVFNDVVYAVKQIGERAFDNCSTLESVTIPKSIIYVAYDAFMNTALYSDMSNWEDGVLYIDDCLISATSTPSNYTIKNNTRLITERAFYWCTTLISLTIPESITSIPHGAFYGCTALESITIPNSVTSIGDAAFSSCSNLASINIPDGVTSIGGWVFSDCTSLTSVTIPNSVSSIGDDAFRSCSSLTSITIPNSVTSIGLAAFYGCSSLNTIYVEATAPPALRLDTFSDTPATTCYIPCGTLAAYQASDWAQYMGELVEECDVDSTMIITYTSMDGNIVTPYDSTAFGANIVSNTYENGVGIITFDAPVTSIGDFAFNECPISTVIIPNGVTSIGNWAFGYTALSNSLIIPEGVTSIGGCAFYNCPITSVTIPGSVYSIKEGAFAHCIALDTIYVGAITPAELKMEAFFDTPATTCYIPCGTLAAYQASDWAQYMGEFVEEGCVDSTMIITYTSTDGNIVTPYDSTVFGANIVSNTYENGVGIITFDAPVTSIGNVAFRGCDGLTSITIPNSVTSIGDDAFWACGLTSITIPNSVTSIGSNAFYYCSKLTSITLGKNLTSIGGYAFSGCDGLTKTNYTGDVEGWCRIQFSPGGGSNPISYSNNLFFNDEELRNLVIPNTIDTIYNYAFYECSSLTSITIPNSVTSIGICAFYYCSKLTSITIPNSVTSIGASAFRGCSSLTSITIPNSVTSIGASAFRDCSGLTSFTIPNNVTTIGDFAFSGCSGLTSITIPNSVTSIGEGAFAFCSNLTSVTLGSGVTSIGNGAFYDCSNIQEVTAYMPTPPAVTIGAFDPTSCTLYVPAEYVGIYSNSVWWEDFKEIRAIDAYYVVTFKDWDGTTLATVDVAAGKAAIAPADPVREGYTFIGWDKDISCITADLDVYAQYEAGADKEFEVIFSDQDNNELSAQSVTLRVPLAPQIAGFTFLYWQPVAEPITNVITIQAIYEADIPTSAPEEYINPANPAQKLLRNGQVYILQDGQTYTIQGQKL